MSAPSDTVAYNYAKFLVDIYPEDAIDILWKSGSRDVIASIAQQVDCICIKLAGSRAERGLAGISQHKIKSMVLDSQWDDLKALRGSPTTSATTTPRHYRHTSERPPTPSSSTSGSPQTQRHQNYEWIIICGAEEKHNFTASPSGSEEYLIREDKLERLQLQKGTISWATPPKRITLGGKMIDVSKHVHLTWYRAGDTATDYKQFWVVGSDSIRHTDVLLGSKQPTPDVRSKG